MIDYTLLIDTFEKQCGVLKVMLKSMHLRDNMNTIGIDQPLRNNDLYEHKCLKKSRNIIQTCW